MFNIWEYADSDFIRVTTKDGEVYEGLLICMLDDEEDDAESVTLDMGNNNLIGIYASDIAEIEDISNEKKAGRKP